MAESVIRYLLDSVILIDHFNGIAAATRFLHEHKQALSISVITRAEVLTGFAPDALVLARQFLETFPALPIDARMQILRPSFAENTAGNYQMPSRPRSRSTTS